MRLRRPESIVIPRSVSRKYFGRDDAIGETLLLNGNHPMTVTAVKGDLPVNGTMLDTGIFASALAPYSSLSTQDDSLGKLTTVPRFT
jgi:putative ABC transport system permease protein